MSSIHFNIRMFARTPSATAAEFNKSEWLDLAMGNKSGGQLLDRFGWLDLEKNSRVCTPVGGDTPVAQVIARPLAASFPLFGKLVVEIQNKIWEMVSLNHSRIITMIEEDVDVTLHPHDDEYTVIGAKRPHFLNSCKGALSAMVGIYQPMFQLNPSHYHGNKRGVFINPQIDVIHLISLRSFRGEAPPWNFVGSLKNREEFRKIRHICLPIHEFHENLQKLAQVVRQLPLLDWNYGELGTSRDNDETRTELPKPGLCKIHLSQPPVNSLAIVSISVKIDFIRDIVFLFSE
ncbi:hypothetical protein EYC84_003539 [Monilinia fructicola]|uniref:2EXR domain-containing protein n=1 Tax=Monilinia fructicola TaxID=38448 RepID=A0A5M9K267_MONFR|nr:hypothetical protein EYC84_003539 [Monilinia fructicola]